MLIKEKMYYGENISNLKLRVTFYARVSTESDEQLNSLDNQITYFKNYIQENKNWTYIPGYIDEGISGSSVKKRKEFLKMIEDAKDGLFDLIITKEVSRFSRNLADSIKYTQLLLQYNVGVFFQTNGINTFDPNSEFILNMMASLAQEEVKRLSLRVKWGHKNAIKRGRILGSNNITGYNKENSVLTINEEEAIKIRKIFTMYATDKYGLNKLGDELYQQGITNSNNNKYDKETLKRIIENPKYKGYYRGHTTEIIDYRLKKRISIPKEEQLIYKDQNIPEIVPVELWEKANEILRKRSQIKKSKQTKITTYPYTNKIICKKHNSPYYRKIIRKKTVTYACNHYIKNGLSSCISPIIKEEDLNNIISIILNEITRVYKNKILTELLNLYNDTPQEKNSIKDLNIKKEKLLELYISNVISKEEFSVRNNLYNEKIDEITNQNKKKDISKIRNFIKEKLLFKEANQYINNLINRIIISSKNDDRTKINLSIYLSLNCNISKFKYITKNKSYYIELFYVEK